MKNDTLRENLEELHLALLQAKPTGKSLQSKRDTLAEQIRETLDQNDLEEIPLSLKETIKKEVIAFEVAHPDVTRIMNQISNMLSAGGV